MTDPMQEPLTHQDIVVGLIKLGLPRGAAVEVHSSLSSLGSVEGGAPTVVDALMDVVGEEGAIVMSAYLVTLPLPLTEDEKATGSVPGGVTPTSTARDTPTYYPSMVGSC